MARKQFNFILLFICLQISTHRLDAQLTVTGNVSIVNLVQDIVYRPGDVITYAFYIQLTRTPTQKAVTSVDVLFNNYPTHIKIESVKDVTCLYLNSDTGNSYALGQSPVSQASIDGGTGIATATIATAIGPNDVINGEYTVKVDEKTLSGSRVRSLVTVSYTDSSRVSYSVTIGSDATHLAAPTFTLYPPTDDAYFGIRAPVSFQLGIDFTSEQNRVAVKAVMPADLRVMEAYMSVRDVIITKSQAVSPQNEEVVVYRDENMNNTVASAAFADFRVIVDKTKDTSGDEVTINTTHYIEDYEALTDAATLWPGVGVMFGGGLLWVAQYALVTNTSVEIVPKINSQLSVHGHWGYDGVMWVTLKVRFSCDNDSNSYGRNLTASLWVPPYVVKASWVWVESEGKTRNTVVGMDGSKVKIETSQVVFTVDTVIYLNISLDGDDERYWKNNKFVIVMDVKFLGRTGKTYWEPPDEIPYLVVNLNDMDKHTAERLHWTKTKTGCTCGSKACACCHTVHPYPTVDPPNPGGNISGCACTDHDVTVCQPCWTMWRCWPRLTDFEYETRLTLPSEETILCRPYQRHNKVQGQRYGTNSGLSCFREKNGTWTGLSAMVSAMIGQDSLNGTIYGVCNHGYGYVRSDDAAVTWKSIRPSDVAKAVLLSSFEKATSRKYNLYDYNIEQ